MDNKILCPICKSENTMIRTFDTLSHDGRPIKERELTCINCGKRSVLP